ncbi:MAG: Flp family type IVb pilin [Nocardioidaceae bacterium]|nr:Flp family type IVb pilin [Nocardioidaceae bacterium]
MIQYLQILLNSRFAKMEERGATAVEYGLLVALIAAVIVTIVATLGTQISEAFTSVSSKLEPASS